MHAVLAVAVLAAASVRAQDPEPAADPLVVTGRVVTWDGQPIAGARVALAGRGALTTAELLQGDGPATAADGTFALPCARTADHVLHVAANGHAARTIDALPPAEPGVDRNRTIALGDVALVPGQRLFGRVRAADGTAVEGALVTLRDFVAQRFEPWRDEAGCSARTGRSGIFDLPCALPRAGVLTVEADGWFTEVRRPVAAGAPLEVELAPSGFLEGVVLDGERPAGGTRLHVHYEASAHGQSVVAGADGTFRAPLRHPGRWRVRAYGERGAASAVHEGAATGVMVRFSVPESEPAPQPPPRLQVRAVTAGTGAAVRTLRAVAQWGPEAGQPWVRMQLAQQLRDATASEDGTVAIDVPAGGVARGVVYVGAPGHAPRLQTDVAWNEAEPSLLVELERESSLAGTVRDEATGEPLAGARVLVVAAAPSWGGFDPPLARVVTGTDGSFRIGELAAGEWELQVAAPGRPRCTPQLLPLAPGEARVDLVARVPRGTAVRGRLTGVPIGRGWRVALHAHLGSPDAQFGFADDLAFDAWGMRSSSWGGPQPAQPEVPVAADGSFVFAGLAPDHYTLLLALPAPPRSGAVLALPIDSFRLRGEDLQRDVDVRGDRPRSIRGRITLPGAVTPFENLVVLALPQAVRFLPYGGGGGGVPRAFVTADGSYELPALDGQYQVVVFDLALGAPLTPSARVDVRGADVTRDFVVLLAKVVLTLEPANERMAVLERVEVRCRPLGETTPDGGIDADEHDQGGGVLVPRGATSLTVALPHGDVTLLARSHAHELRGQHHPEALGRLELVLPADAALPAKLAVAPPPEIPDELPDDGR